MISISIFYYAGRDGGPHVQSTLLGAEHAPTHKHVNKKKTRMRFSATYICMKSRGWQNGAACKRRYGAPLSDTNIWAGPAFGGKSSQPVNRRTGEHVAAIILDILNDETMRCAFLGVREHVVYEAGRNAVWIEWGWFEGVLIVMYDFHQILIYWIWSESLKFLNINTKKLPTYLY